MGIDDSPPRERDDMIVHQEQPYNAEPRAAALAAHPLTDRSAFYHRNHGEIQHIQPAVWRLRVDGMVDRPLELSLAELQERFDHHEVIATLQCAGNRRAGLMEIRDIPGQHPWGPGATSTAVWGGVRLTDVLNAAGLQPAVTHVAFEAPDIAPEADPPQGFGGSVAASKATAHETLLAWQMNGDPLAAEHGAPVRVVVPGHIGARSVKWVERITAQDHPSDNFFQAEAYRLLPADADTDATGPGDGVALQEVALNAAILEPDADSVVAPGTVLVRGYAFAGGRRGISRVDVSPDGGRTWTQAELEDVISPWAWRFWHARIDLAAGRHEIVARAWDSTAALQPESPDSLWNPKGYTNNSWPRVVVIAGAPDR